MRAITPMDEKIVHCELLHDAHGLPPIFPHPLNRRSGAGTGAGGAWTTAPRDESCTSTRTSPAVSPCARRRRREISARRRQRRTVWAPRRVSPSARCSRTISAPGCRARWRCRSRSPRGSDADGRIVSVAYGAIHARLVSLQWVVTDPAARGRGHARANLSALMHWAAERRPGRLPAGLCRQPPRHRALCESLGFAQELYRYHYRVR